MKIIESFVEGETQEPEKCEDALLYTDNYACVVDGATSKYDVQFDNKTGGRIAAEIITNTVKKLPYNANWHNVLNAIENELNSYYKEKSLLEFMEENPGARAQAAMAIYSGYLKEVCIIADCQCMIDNKLYFNYLNVDEARAKTRAFFLEAELCQGKTVEELLENDTGSEFIKPLMKLQLLFKNSSGNQFSYGAVDGLKIPREYIKIIKVPHGAKSIILASDGYPIIKPTLKETEETLKALIKKDPLCIRENKQLKAVYKGQVSFDDRAYLKIEL